MDLGESQLISVNSLVTPPTVATIPDVILLLRKLRCPLAFGLQLFT